MIDYWRIRQGDYWTNVLCGGCNGDVEFIWNDGEYTLPEKCPECGWVPTKFYPGEK